MLNAGKNLAAVLQALEVSESTLERWRAVRRREAVVGGAMKREEAKRLKHLKDENRRLKQLVTDQALDIPMLKHLSEGNW
jgi:predicted ATPase